MAEPMAHDGWIEQSAKGEKGAAPVAPRAKRPRPSRPVLDWVMRHQIELASTFVLSIVALHAISPATRPLTSKLLFLSYPSNKTEGTYIQGKDDVYFVFAWVVYFTGLRAFSIEWVLQPMATRMGIVKKNSMRFAEQGWLVMYYSVFWSLGMYLWYNSSYWFDNAAMWRSWPSREMSTGLKWYYLVQLAFWLQQILVIHLEAPRKDHYQMLIHHLITSTLVSVAYGYRFGNVGNVVLCLMDIVDLVLPLAKILKYLGYQTICDIAFGVFVVTWLISRHIMYPKLCYNIYAEVPSPNTMEFGCYYNDRNELATDFPAHPDYFSHLLWPFQDNNKPICLNAEVKWIFLGMLLMLQALSLWWFTMIVKVVAKVLMGGSAEDTRSDDESEEDEEIEEINDTASIEAAAYGKRNADVTDVNVCRSNTSSTQYNTIGASNGVSRLSSPRPRPTSARRRLMDAENRKELLARIGCEKPVQ